jgi:cupin superfamily acireductone dioxygenase involved in methionine salvage
MDLTLLIIEQTKSDAEKVMTELQELKTIINALDTSQLIKLESDLKSELTKFEEELKPLKIKKY